MGVQIDQNELVNRFIGLSREVKKASSEEGLEPFGPDVIKTWMVKGHSMKIMKEDSAKNYQKILELLFDEREIATHFTRKEVEKRVRNTIEDIIEDYSTIENGAAQEVEQLMGYFQSELAKVDNWKFILPLINLKVETLPMDIGNVQLSKFTEGKYDQWIAKEREILEANPHYNTQEEIQGVLDRSKKYVYSLLLDNPLYKDRDPLCAEVEVKNRFERAHEKAVEEVKKSLKAIKLFWGIYHDNIRANFGLLGEVIPRNSEGTKSVHLGKTKKEVKHSPIERGSVAPFDLDNDFLEDMNEWGFQELCEILAKDDPSKLERRIIASIYWFGEAVDTNITARDNDQEKALHYEYDLVEGLENFEIAERFLKLMVALEILLVRGRESKSDNISRRVAFLLGKDDEGRKAVYERMGKFYRIRNSIVHSGLTAPIKTLEKLGATMRSSTNRLLRDTKTAILVLIQNRDEFSIEDKGIREWDKEQTLKLERD